MQVNSYKRWTTNIKKLTDKQDVTCFNNGCKWVPRKAYLTFPGVRFLADLELKILLLQLLQ